MNYQRIHDEIICHAKSRILPKDTYKESHHIIPKCLGGTNDKSNLVNLTAREHYIIHWLLYKIHKIQELACAWHRMCNSNDIHKRYNSHTFEYARKVFAQTVSILHSGKIVSDDTRKKISNANKGRPSPFKGIKTNKPITKEMKEKQSLTWQSKPIMKCPKCGISGTHNMNRYHFDNCSIDPSNINIRINRNNRKRNNKISSIKGLCNG